MTNILVASILTAISGGISMALAQQGDAIGSSLFFIATVVAAGFTIFEIAYNAYVNLGEPE